MMKHPLDCASTSMSLISEMMAMGGVCALIESLETPRMLVMHMSDSALLVQHGKLMKTRRKYMVFGLNERVFLLSRKQSIAIVQEEIKAQDLMPNVALTGRTRSG